MGNIPEDPNEMNFEKPKYKSEVDFALENSVNKTHDYEDSSNVSGQ